MIRQIYLQHTDKFICAVLCDLACLKKSVSVCRLLPRYLVLLLELVKSFCRLFHETCIKLCPKVAFSP